MKKQAGQIKYKIRNKKRKRAVTSMHHSEAQKNEMKRLMQAMFNKWKNSKP